MKEKMINISTFKHGGKYDKEVLNMILEIEDSKGKIYVCNIVECDENGELIFENLKDSKTSISLADVSFDEYFGTNDMMIRLHLEE